MPQTRSPRIPDPIGVEGEDQATQASPTNHFPVSVYGNAAHTSTQIPASGMTADQDFTGSEWIDIRDKGNFIFLVAGTEDFATVELEWSDDGVNPNGNTTAITNTPVVSAGLTFNVYLSILNVFVSGSYVRAHIVNGPTPQTEPPFVGICSSGRDSYLPLIGIESDISLILQAVLTRSILAGKLPDGTFANVLLSPNASLITKLEGSDVTPSGAQWSEGTLDYITHDFGTDTVVTEVAKLQDLSTGGTVTPDATDGGAVFATGVAAGNTAIFLSEKFIPYNINTGHGAILDISLFEEPDSAGISGDAYVEWGLGDGTGNGLGWGYDANGYYTFLKKGGSYTSKAYQDDGAGGTDWNGDPLDGSLDSQFRRAGLPEAILISKDNLYRITSEFLYAAEQNYFVKRPRGQHLLAHTHEYPNNHTFTSLKTANLNAVIEIHNDTSTGGNLKFRSGSWRGGVFSNRTISSARQPDGDLVDIPTDGEVDTHESAGLAADGTPQTFTVDTATDEIIDAAHGLLEGQAILLTTTGTLPGGLELETIYHVRNPTTDRFQVSLLPTSEIIDITTTGTGTHSYFTRGAYVMPVADTDGYRGLEIAIETDKAGFLEVFFTPNTQATPTHFIAGPTRVYTADMASIGDFVFRFGAALDGFTWRFSNDSGSPSSIFNAYTNIRVQAVESPQGPISAGITDSSSATITRGVIVGKKDDGTGDYENSQVHSDALGTSLVISPGHRLSQVFGRTPITIPGEAVTADTNLRTNTAGKTFYCVGYSWALTNSTTASVARVIVRDGIGGELRIPIKVQEGALGADFTATGSGSFPDEGLPFATGVYVDVISGTVSLDIVLHGYEEDN